MSELVTFVVLGLATGSIYGLAGMGLTLTYTTSGVLNFGHGAIAALGGYVFVQLHQSADVPWPLALAATAAGVGLICGMTLEALTRRLLVSPLYLQIAATVGVLLAVVGGLTVVFGSDARFVADFLPNGTVAVGDARVGVDRLIFILLGAGSALGLAACVRYSRVGRRMRAVVDDPVLLEQCGTSSTSVRRRAWAIGAAVSAACGALLTPTLGLDPVLLTLVVLQSLGAAALGRFASLGWTYGGGLAIGVAAALATWWLGGDPVLGSVPAAVPLIVFALVVAFRPPAGPPRSAPALLRRVRLPSLARRRTWATAAATVALAVPWLVGARLPAFTNAAAFVVIFVSLALVINQSGQVSLGHGALCAVGAAVLSHTAGEGGIPWVPALVLAAVVSAAVGIVVSLLFARVPGVAVALGTLAFVLVMERLAYASSVMFGTAGIREVWRPGGPFGSDRGYYYVVVGCAALAIATARRVRQGRFGRLSRAMGDDPELLSALGASVSTTRAAVFGLSGALAGTGGALAAAGAQSVSGNAFGTLPSLVWLAVLVIGGTNVTAAPVRAALGLAIAPVYLAPVIRDQQVLWFGALAVVAAVVQSRYASREAAVA